MRTGSTTTCHMCAAGARTVSKPRTWRPVMVPKQMLDQEIAEKVNDDAEYEKLVKRLSKASVEKHWRPYIDIPWDDPDYAIRLDDERWALPPIDSLGSHPWFQDQPLETRVGIGL